VESNQQWAAGSAAASPASLRRRTGPAGGALRAVSAASLACLALASAQAAELDTGSDLKLRWDNTLKYSVGTRLSDPNALNLGAVNGDDAARNFSKNDLITNRAEFLSELDARYHNFGFQLSAAGWYDAVYTGSTGNTSQATFNPSSVPVGEFPDDVKKIAGRRIELRNAFALGQFDVAGAPVAVRLGRHTVLWGESLYFTDNGIAAGMAPVDAYSALGVPSLQAKEVFMPTNQLSAAAILGNFTLEGYYQLEWRKTRIPPAGTFFSPVDLLDAGGERVFTPFGPSPRGADQKPDKAQFGLALKWRPDAFPVDFGLYALRYNDKTPSVVSSLTTGQYYLTYKEGIKMYGLSATTTLGSTNLGAEVSYRQGVPLVTNTPALLLGGPPIDNSNPVYPVGDSVHYQLSAIYAGKAGWFWDNMSIAGEIGGHQLSRITANAANLDGTRDRHAFGMRGTLSFDYYQVLPGLDLTVPLTVGYNPMGKSPISTAFNTYGSHRGADVTLGLTGVYALKYRGGLSVTRFYGKEAQNLYRDRSFATAYVSMSF
jgi:hypothetical protein